MKTLRVASKAHMHMGDGRRKAGREGGRRGRRKREGGSREEKSLGRLSAFLQSHFS